MSAWSDIRIACRSLARSKGFAAAAVLTLSLGIAATTTIFSVVYGVLLRPLPYADASELVVIEGEKAYSTGPRILNFSAPELEPFIAAAQAFSSIALTRSNALTFKSASNVELISSATVSGEFFNVLGTAPLIGRTVADESEPNIVISERLWQRVFNGSPQVIGQPLRLTGWQNNERVYTIVGVMPHDFQYPRPRTDIWRTLAFSRAVGDDRVRELFPGGHTFVARIRPGVAFEAARDDAVRVVNTVLKPHFTPYRLDIYAKVTPLTDSITGSVHFALWTLMGAMGLVMLVACANVANLILVRHSTRSREISVHLALGAPRGRLLTWLLTEVALIALAGVVLGVLSAQGGIRALRWMQPVALPRLDAIQVDATVIAFACATAGAAVLLAGLIPASIATRTDAVLALRLGGRSGASSALAQRLRSALIVVEIATSIVLLVGAGLLSRSLLALMNTDLGVNTENVVAANLDMSPGRVVTPERQAQIARDLEERVAALPGVRSAGFGSGVPPTGEYMRLNFDFSNGKSTDSHMFTAVPASPGYFSTLQIPVMRGRLFTQADAATALPVVILSREAARRLFGGDDPLGRTLPLISKQWTVVGVVENVKYTGLASGPDPVIYMPFEQSPIPISVVLVRTSGDAAAFAAQLRDVIRSYDAGIGIPRLETLQWWMSDAVRQPRMRAIMLSAIATITLLLAMVGLYGVIAYSTSQRRAEIGVRMAIGAQHGDVMRLVLGEGVRLTLTGIVLGLGAAWWSSRLLAAFLHGVTATDMTSFATAVVCLFIVAVAATSIPAWKAARIDPAVALRSE